MNSLFDQITKPIYLRSQHVDGDVCGPLEVMCGPRDSAVSAGLLDRSSWSAKWRRKLPKDQGWWWWWWVFFDLIGNVKGWNGIAAVLCILITADNRSPAILKSPIHPLPPPINGSSFKWPGCCVTLLFTRLYVGPGRRKLTQ